MYYFASDMHLGLDSPYGSSREREELLVKWLDEVSADAKAIFLVGDVFDFWFEYKRVVPKGFSRLLGKLSELTDRGTEIHFFAGNHDMWAYDYLHTECGLVLHDKPKVFDLSGKKVLVAHGDNMYTEHPPVMEHIMHKIFRSQAIRRIFAVLIHPDQAMRFGHWWSGKSRKAKNLTHRFAGEQEYLVKYARKYLETADADYFVFGHLHCAEDYDLGNGKHMIVLGEWISTPSYAVLDSSGNIRLKYYK